MRPRWSRAVPFVAALVTIALLGACTESDLELGTDDPGPIPDASPDEGVRTALDDLEVYWGQRLPEVYGLEFEPVATEFPYGPMTEVPQCGPSQLDYDDVAENALYCPQEDLIAWDRVNLMPQLQADFGPLTVGIVMAHEYAHAVQNRAGVSGDTVTLELQADCFAGAWAADVSDRIAVFSTADDRLDDAIGGFLELRDSVGVSARNPQAHGTGFDRVSAFQDGFEQGNDVCASYEDDPPPTVAIPFLSGEDLANEGNLPVEDLVEPLLADLESFYTALFAQRGEVWDPISGLAPVDPDTEVVDCGDETIEDEELEVAAFYCVPDDVIYIDRVDLVPTLVEIGDFAFGGEIARQYAFAAQVQLGLFDEVGDGRLHADCFTGSYAAAEFTENVPDQQLFLSPGDLDEIVIAFLSVGEDDGATAFERTGAFRAGFVDGADACATYL